MAISSAMRESLKRELIAEIKRQLTLENTPLSPIVHDAVRLANICKKYDYCMLLAFPIYAFGVCSCSFLVHPL